MRRGGCSTNGIAEQYSAGAWNIFDVEGRFQDMFQSWRRTSTAYLTAVKNPTLFKSRAHILPHSPNSSPSPSTPHQHMASNSP